MRIAHTISQNAIQWQEMYRKIHSLNSNDILFFPPCLLNSITHQCICSHGLLVLEKAGLPIDMKAAAKKYYPPFTDAKTCKDNFISLMAQPLIVPSVDNIPETYVGKDDECLVLDTSKIKAPPDRPKTNRNKISLYSWLCII